MATASRGTASFTLNASKDTLLINGSFTGLSGPITMAHVHNGFEGVAGPVVTDLMPLVKGKHNQGSPTKTNLTPANIGRYLRGSYYLMLRPDYAQASKKYVSCFRKRPFQPPA